MTGAFFHPETGEDITEDVLRELQAIVDQDDAVLFATAEARQKKIAAAFRDGDPRTFKTGHMVAQIDARIVDWWRRHKGREFWQHELKWFLKQHPECAVVARSERPTVRLTHLPPSSGRGGRWRAA